MINILQPDSRIRDLILPQEAEPGILYVPSQYVFPYSFGGRSYLFHTLTRQLICGELPDQAGAGEGFDELIESMYLVPEDMDEDGFYTYVVSLNLLNRQKTGFRVCTILPTLACNARCVYCYEEGALPVSMSERTAEQVIRYLLENGSKEKLEIAWFGGEPLLRPDMISRICEGLAAAGVGFSSSMISNGSLITPEIIGKMKGLWNLKHIQISMDGAEEDYIRRKRYKAAGDQYHDVLRNIDLMAEAGIKVTIRCNVDEENCARIPLFLEELHEKIKNRSKVVIYFSPLNSVKADKNDMEVWKKIWSAAPLIRDAGFLENYPGKTENFRFRSYHCMADKGDPVILPDGTLHACEHCLPESRFGDIWNGTTDESGLREYTRTDRVAPKCHGCVFLPECTAFTGCPVKEYHCRELCKTRLENRLSTALPKQLADQADPVI